MKRLSYLLVAIACGIVAACDGGPTEPRGPLPIGRWGGGGACLSVGGTDCDFTVGCGHGQFPRPTVRADGTFDVDGTYRIEIGPVSLDPAPPAHFSGVLSGSTLTLKVVPTATGLAPASYTLRQNASVGCPLCV